MDAAVNFQESGEVKEALLGAEEIRVPLKEVGVCFQVKKMDGIAETTSTLDFANQMEENTTGLSMEPLELTQKGAPRVALIFMILALGVAGASVFMFAREFAMRKQADLGLAHTEQARAQLEQSLVQLQTEMANQREEINHLNSDLQAAQAKAALIDKLRQEHQEEISRIKNRYEGQLTSLQKVLETKESLISSLQSNLKSIRELLEKGETPLGTVAAAGSVGVVESAVASPSGGSSSEFKPVSGKVLTVNRDQHFIITNLSVAEGAQIGRFVQIYQKGQPIGQGRIDRVYQNLSAATILSEDTLTRIGEGDQVILALA